MIGKCSLVGNERLYRVFSWCVLHCLRSFCLVKLRVPAPQDALGLVTMMWHQVIVMNAALLGHTRMLKTDNFGETRLALHVPSSS